MLNNDQCDCYGVPDGMSEQNWRRHRQQRVQTRSVLLWRDEFVMLDRVVGTDILWFCSTIRLLLSTDSFRFY